VSTGPICPDQGVVPVESWDNYIDPVRNVASKEKVLGILPFSRHR
jgi:hypothetical protein